MEHSLPLELLVPVVLPGLLTRLLHRRRQAVVVGERALPRADEVRGRELTRGAEDVGPGVGFGRGRGGLGSVPQPARDSLVKGLVGVGRVGRVEEV